MVEPIPCRWWLVRPANMDISDVSVLRSVQMSGPDLYKVLARDTWCLSKSGAWDYEPQPSSRTAEYLKTHRFATLDEAVAAWRKAPPV